MCSPEALLLDIKFSFACEHVIMKTSPICRLTLSIAQLACPEALLLDIKFSFACEHVVIKKAYPINFVNSSACYCNRVQYSLNVASRSQTLVRVY